MSDLIREYLKFNHLRIPILKLNFGADLVRLKMALYVILL